jgi:hypothetical protein
MATRKFQTIPPYTGNNDAVVLRGLTDVMSYITAQAQPAIQPLATTATLAQTIAKINEVIARLQGTQ